MAVAEFFWQRADHWGESGED